jgi:hypothetical protein
MLEEIGEGPHLKDDATFVLLIMVSPHMVTMFNELDNLLRLDTIFEWEARWARKSCWLTMWQ